MSAKVPKITKLTRKTKSLEQTKSNLLILENPSNNNHNSKSLGEAKYFRVVSGTVHGTQISMKGTVPRYI
jgi:hypothetical protein